jgi:hypothetical protein
MHGNFPAGELLVERLAQPRLVRVLHESAND